MEGNNTGSSVKWGCIVDEKKKKSKSKDGQYFQIEVYSLFLHCKIEFKASNYMLNAFVYFSIVYFFLTWSSLCVYIPDYRYVYR